MTYVCTDLLTYLSTKWFDLRLTICSTYVMASVQDLGTASVQAAAEQVTEVRGG